MNAFMNGFCFKRDHEIQRQKKKKLSCRGEGSVAGLQRRVRLVPAALLAVLRTALFSSVFLELEIGQVM
jgi:hypothetical protein